MATHTSVTIYQSVIRATTVALATRTVNEILREVEIEAKVRTAGGKYSIGLLSASIRKSPPIVRGDVVTGQVSSPLRYAKWVHDGTRPHIIRPRPPRKRLRFFWLRVGKWVRPPYVHHPGQQGKKFMTDPLVRIAARHGWAVYTYRA